MKVIIKKTKEIKNVSFGYAVNFLIPKGLAVQATEEALRKLKEQEEKERAKIKEREIESQEKAEEIKEKILTIKKKADEKGRLYGSLSKMEIAKELGVKTRAVILVKPIKKLGEYGINLKIDKQKTKVKIKVEAIN